MNDLKLYIAILDEVPDEMVPVLVAHAVLNAHIKFSGMPLSLDAGFKYADWLLHSFKKVTVEVNRKEFAKISEMPFVYLGHENKTLGGKKSCAIVCPRDEYPNVIKFAKLWKPNDHNQTNR